MNSGLTPTNESQTFKTSDYGLAALLDAHGFPIYRVEQIEPRRLVFIYRSSPALMAAVGGWTSDAPVGCRKYFLALHRVKKLIWEGMRDDRQ